MEVNYILLFIILAVLIVIGVVYYFMEMSKEENGLNEASTYQKERKEHIQEHA